jgi:hypothetical protein
VSIETFERRRGRSRSVSALEHVLEERAEVLQVDTAVGDEQELRQGELALAEDAERARHASRPKRSFTTAAESEW